MDMRRATFAALGFVLLPTLQAYAQEHHATEPEKLGTVHFATSCNPAVAPKFDRAVALLHSFEFGGSIRGFNDVLAADSTCAMAYWGVSSNSQQSGVIQGLTLAACLCSRPKLQQAMGSLR